MRYKNLIGALLLTISLLLPGSQALATVWTDHYDVSNGYSSAGQGISTITFDDWGYSGPGGRTAKNFAPINGFGAVGQRQHVVTLWTDRLTPDNPQNILKDITNSPVYTNSNMDTQVNFYFWGYTSPGFDRQSDYTAYKAGDYSASARKGSIFNNMQIDLDGDYLVRKADMHFAYYDTFSYVDATGVNPPQDVATTLSFQPYPVSDAIGWCGSVLAPHPAALAVMAGQLTFDFAFDVYNGPNHVFMGTQVVPRFEMRSYGTLNVHVWAGSDLQTFTSDAVINNTNPNNKDRWDVDPNYYNLVSFAGGGVLPDGAWVSADSYNADGSRKLNPDGTWNVTVVPAGTPGATWYNNAFAGYAFILRADAIRMLDWYDTTVYGPDPCTNVNCNDNNVCTTDSCVGGVCVHTPMTCPTGQACDPATGVCAPVDLCTGVVCNDNNACTTDTCDPSTGCVYTPIVCNDNNPCTTDTCNPATGCVYTPLICDDHNACTTDACGPEGCIYVPAVVCNDNNPCTTDACDPATGACVFTPVNCDDGNACTTDSCDPATGKCVHTPTNACSTVDTTNNNFTMNQPDGTAFGGSNDVHFTWDGTRKTSVAASGQVSNATLASTCSFFGKTWAAHDVAIYGPGTYTVYSGCPAGSPGCGLGDPITFTVNPGEIGGHMLFNWNNNNDIDVVDVWKPKAAYGPSPLWTGACGSNPTAKVWDWMSYDWDGDGVNGYMMVDGPFLGMNANFNMMGIPVAVNTTNNNFTMNQPDGTAFGGSNDVHFTWDGTRKTSVAASGQVSNATLASTCSFFGKTWAAHDVAVYGPGTYTVYTGCPAGSPGCGAGDPITFTVNAGEIGGHMLFNWNNNNDIDVVDIWKPKAAYGPSPLWTGACGSNPDTKIWDWMSYDWDGDGVNGYMMVDGPFLGMNANFNMMGTPPDPCSDAATRCNDNNACTTDTCDPATGVCVHTPIVCNDNNLCTIDTCDPATGCVYTPVVITDNNACTTDVCDPATGIITHTVIICNDNNACTVDSCDPATGCVFTPIVCNDNNLCTIDTCDPVMGCIFTPVNCPLGYICNPATGQCEDPCAGVNCNDNNSCTNDTCNPTTGCVYTLVADGTACTINSQAGTCKAGQCIASPICPAGSVKSVTIRGGGQKPTTVDLVIQTQFTVMNDGCISGSTVSTVTVTPGTALLVNVNAGQGPPTSCTWNGVPIDLASPYTIICPDVSGDVGKLICDNKLNGGQDVDRMTIKVQ